MMIAAKLAVVSIPKDQEIVYYFHNKYFRNGKMKRRF